MTAFHTIEHELEYRYDHAVHGSVMTLFVSPLADRNQTLHGFSLETDPAGSVSDFVDCWGNRGHFLDRHHPHTRLRIVARSRVKVDRAATLPETLGPGAHEDLKRSTETPEVWLMLQPSRFVRPSSPALAAFVAANGIAPRDDPMTGLRTLQSKLHEVFDYAPGSTVADSPIDHILETGCGVCQDYSHVMASICRGWGIPARYVSGYLGVGAGNTTRGESHAWVECRLPELGWTGFDPANNCLCDQRHVRVAVGRDYADVPPSRGVYSGPGTSVLTARVTVTSRGTGPSSNGSTLLHDNTPTRSTTPCNPSDDPSPSAPSSGSRQSSRSLPSQSRPAASPPRSAPTSSAATSGAAPISASRWRFSPG